MRGKSSQASGKNKSNHYYPGNPGPRTLHEKEWRAWYNMKRRCYDPTCKGYSAYGGRGVSVCDLWRYDFDEFFAHIGPAPSERHVLDRIDPWGNYTPGNIRWATPGQSADNVRERIPPLTQPPPRQRPRKLAVAIPISAAEPMSITAMAKALGISRISIYMRIRRGWTFEEATSTPKGKRPTGRR